MRPAFDQVAITGLVKFDTIRKVEDVSERELVAGNILLVAQNLFVDIEPGFEARDVLRNLRLVGCLTTPSARCNQSLVPKGCDKDAYDLKIFSAATPDTWGSQLETSTEAACSTRALFWRSSG